MIHICCFGEVLWDLFPTFKRIGGAPLNVALRLNSLGAETNMISRIGNDENGKTILNYIEKAGLSSAFIQKDNELETGTVVVHLDQSKTASYTIKKPVAWDRVEMQPEIIPVIKEANALIFGSLACRSKETESTLLALIKKADYKVFDVNLRPPFYDLHSITNLLVLSDFVKMNEEEMDEICSHLDLAGRSFEQKSQSLIEHLGVEKSICVTKGAKGATLYYGGNFFHNPGYPVKVRDTVGAGDSFLATLIYHLLTELAPQKALDLACATGSLVASKDGANPEIKNSEIENLING